MAKKSLTRQKASASGPNITLPAVSNASEVPGVYVNTVEMLSMNHIDVRIAFNEVAIESGNIARVIRRANIVMPTAAFMTMLQVLNGNAQLLYSKVQEQAEEEKTRIQKFIQSKLEAAAQIEQPKV